jgi:hypothetical protein
MQQALEPPLPVQPERAWVNLTDEDYARIDALCLTPTQAAMSAAHILKKKNATAHNIGAKP